MIAQSEELRFARVAGGVLALGRVGELGPRAENVAMRVDGSRRQLGNRGLLGPAYQSSQPFVFSNGPVTGLEIAFIGAFNRCI